MDFDQLEIFVQVASRKSFSKTAESLFISQPTVSSRVKALEQELGSTLLDRSHPEGLALTGEGRIFLDYAQEMLNMKKKALSKMGRENKEEEFLHLGASTVPGCYLLPEVLAEYRKERSEVNISLTVKDTSMVVEGVLNYEYQLGLVGSRGQETSLVYEDLVEDELVLVVPVAFARFASTPSDSKVTMQDCFEQVLLIREPGSATRQVFEKAVKDKGRSLWECRDLIYFNTLEGIKQGVRFGLGASVLSRRSVEDYLEMGYVNCYRIEDLDLRRSFYLVYHKGRVQGTASNAFINYIRERLKGSKGF